MTEDSIRAMLKSCVDPFLVLLDILRWAEDSLSRVMITLDKGDSGFFEVEMSSRGMYFDSGSCMRPEDIKGGLPDEADIVFRQIEELGIEIGDYAPSPMDFMLCGGFVG